MGIMLYDMGEKGDPVKSEPLWKNAMSVLDRFCKLAPGSPLAGTAYIRQIDISLERMFDLSLASLLSKQAADWGKNATKAEGAPQPETPNAPATGTPALPNADDRRTVAFHCLLRAGLVAYLQEDFELAQQMFEAGGPAKPIAGVPNTFTTNGIGLYLLKTISQKKMPVWFEDSLKAAVNDHQRLAIKLADLYIYGEQSAKAIAIYKRFLSRDPVLAPVSPTLESYCVMQLALAYSESTNGSDKAIELYNTLYAPQYANCSWTPDGILRLGVLMFNVTHDPKKAMPHLEYVFTKYPNHPEAERALGIYCVVAVEAKDKALAEKSIAMFLQRYPTSGWKTRILSLQAHILTTPKSGQPTGRARND